MPARFLLVLGLTTALQVIGLGSAAATEAPSKQHVRVRIYGPIAYVTVTRRFVASQHALASRARLAVFDVALPKHAAGFKADVLEPLEAGQVWRSGNSDIVLAAAGDSLALARKASADSDTRYRIVLQGLAERDTVELRYDFAVPLRCDAGHWVLSFPGAGDLMPLASDVDVVTQMPAGLKVVAIDVAGHAAADHSGLRAMRGQAPAQAPWDVRLRIEARHATGDAVTASDTALGVRFAGSKNGPTAWWGICRGRSSKQMSWPQTVVAVIDVSRSVGGVGQALEKQFVQTFMAAMPGGVRWNAVLFNRTAQPLFPVFRMLTDETLARLDEVMVPGGLQNGTSLRAGLTMAAELLRKEGHASNADSLKPHRTQAAEQINIDPRVGQRAQPKGAWLVVVSDGSLPDEAHLGLLGDTAGAWDAAAVILVRPEGEELPDARGRAAFEMLAKQQTGLLRILRPPGVAQAARAATVDLLGGGDWFSISSQPGNHKLSGSLGPGSGLGSFLFGGAPPPRRVQFASAGSKRGLGISYFSRRLTWPGSESAELLAKRLGHEKQAFLLPMPEPPPEIAAAGELERSVLKDALSLAFLPRARACYLNRSAKTAQDRDLIGRVRLSLQLERGEVLGVRVVSSSLSRETIEACLVEAAYALAIPRPSGRDAPVEAILNLVFRPLTVPEAAQGSALDQEIEVLLGPGREKQSPEQSPAFDLRLLDETAPSP